MMTQKMRIKKVADSLCKIWKWEHDQNPTDPWHRLEYRQGIRDALECMKHNKLIKDYNMNGAIEVEDSGTTRNG